MAEMMDAQSIDACKFRHSTKPLPKIPCVRSFEIAFEPRRASAWLRFSAA